MYFMPAVLKHEQLHVVHGHTDPVPLHSTKLYRKKYHSFVAIGIVTRATHS